MILGGLAFLAFLVQTFQALFLAHQAVTTGNSHNPNLVGGIVSSVVPTKLRTLGTEDERLDDILAAIRLYVSTYLIMSHCMRPLIYSWHNRTTSVLLRQNPIGT